MDAKIAKWIEKGTVDKLEKILSKGSAQEKADLIAGMGQDVNEETLNLLINQLRSSDQEVRKTCILALGQSRDKRGIEFLRKITRDEPDTPIAEMAREAIHKITG